MDVTIIIDGIKHKLVPDTHAHKDCSIECSLHDICFFGTDDLCSQFQSPTHFEIKE